MGDGAPLCHLKFVQVSYMQFALSVVVVRVGSRSVDTIHKCCAEKFNKTINVGLENSLIFSVLF